MSELRYPEWQTPYREAILEVDEEKLEAKIHLAFKRFPPIATTMGRGRRLPMR